jgi:CRP-like cAMP-binding protein
VTADDATLGPFLAALGADDALALRALGRVRHYAAGDTIIHQGDDPGGVSVLLAGHAKVVALIPGGKDVLLAFRGPGDIVGEVAALAGRTRTSSVRAIDAVQTLAVSAADFRAFLATHAAASLELVLMLIDRVLSSDDARLQFAAHDVVGRVARRLIELCERFGEPSAQGMGITIAISQEELAAWTASSREAVVKAMRLLRELGWIENQRRRIVVRDLDALRRYAA